MPRAGASGDGVQATCGETTPIAKVQLKEHVVKDHNVIFSLKKAKRANKVGESDNEMLEEVEYCKEECEIQEKSHVRDLTPTIPRERRQPWTR